jgi:uncharacterized damage-inducible protein DinB
MKNPDLSKLFLDQARRLLREVYQPRVERCLRRLSLEQIWWRANPASNSVGNLALHLEGNVRQWIVSGLGGAPDTRQRDREFAERGPIPRRALPARLRKTVNQACAVLRKLSSSDLSRTYTIQGYRVKGLKAVFHVAEHFSHHAGQIILATKMLRGQDLGFTHLPREAAKQRAVKSLPAV